MPGTLALEVVTPEVALVTEPARAVTLRTADGMVTVMAGFAAVIAAVVPGEVTVELADGAAVRLAVHGGFVQVDTSAGAAEGYEGVEEGPVPGLSTKVTLLAGVAERAEDIDVARATRAKEEAEARLVDLRAQAGPAGAVGPEGEAAEPAVAAELADMEAALVRAEVRLAVAGATE